MIAAAAAAQPCPSGHAVHSRGRCAPLVAGTARRQSRLVIRNVTTLVRKRLLFLLPFPAPSFLQLVTGSRLRELGARVDLVECGRSLVANATGQAGQNGRRQASIPVPRGRCRRAISMMVAPEEQFADPEVVELAGAARCHGSASFGSRRVLLQFRTRFRGLQLGVFRWGQA